MMVMVLHFRSFYLFLESWNVYLYRLGYNIYEELSLMYISLQSNKSALYHENPHAEHAM